MTFRLNRSLFAMMSLLMLSVPAIAQDNSEEDSTGTKVEEVKAKGDSNFTVRMKNNKFLQGVPIEFAFIDIYILGTKISVPLEDVHGLRMGESIDDKGSIALKNGEVLNGRIDPPEVKLAIDWGQAIVKRDVIKSMVRSRDLYWQMKDTPTGSMWFLAPRYYRSSATEPPAKENLEPTGTVSKPQISAKAIALAFPDINSHEFNWVW